VPEYWLHYLGKSLYTLDRVRREASRIGVQRAIPFTVLKSMSWGTPILLATWQGVRDSDGKVSLSRGIANVHGYFTVESLVHNLPKEIAEKLWQVLNILTFSGSPHREERYCGSYTVSGVAVVVDSLEDIVDRIEEICKEHGLDPRKFKYFIRGSFTEFKRPITLFPAKFTRGYMRVEIKGLELRETLDEGRVIWIYDYSQRAYVSAKDVAALESVKLTEWMSVV